jgi:hypothetical protein
MNSARHGEQQGLDGSDAVESEVEEDRDHRQEDHEWHEMVHAREPVQQLVVEHPRRRAEQLRTLRLHM